MDNAPYHSVQKDKAPTSNSKKLDLISWLQSKGIEANENLLKNELVQLVKLNKPRQPTYILDEIAKQHGHTVLRLPPYHCHYNAIERIWAHVKGYAAEKNTSPPFTANKMLNLLHNACEVITAETWRKVVEHTKKLIQEDWDRDVHFDSICGQEFIINLRDSSSSSEYDDDDDELDLGCTPLCQ